jgi:hypothetical protein
VDFFNLVQCNLVDAVVVGVDALMDAYPATSWALFKSSWCHRIDDSGRSERVANGHGESQRRVGSEPDCLMIDVGVARSNDAEETPLKKAGKDCWQGQPQPATLAMNGGEL